MRNARLALLAVTALGLPSPPAEAQAPPTAPNV